MCALVRYWVATPADADDPVRPDAEVPQFAADATGFAHLADESFALFRATHGRTAAGRTPHRRNDRADYKSLFCDFIRQLLDLVVG